MHTDSAVERDRRFKLALTRNGTSLLDALNFASLCGRTTLSTKAAKGQWRASKEGLLTMIVVLAFGLESSTRARAHQGTFIFRIWILTQKSIVIRAPRVFVGRNCRIDTSKSALPRREVLPRLASILLSLPATCGLMLICLSCHIH
jgi:hypothetical protein